MLSIIANYFAKNLANVIAFCSLDNEVDHASKRQCNMEGTINNNYMISRNCVKKHFVFFLQVSLSHGETHCPADEMSKDIEDDTHCLTSSSLQNSGKRNLKSWGVKILENQSTYAALLPWWHYSLLNIF